ncbi:hypothetical protein BDQ17DRAFT_1311423 [Cyathus striatus]|nr:hypothetical protein BDQ17DRAFT_1311423 [Cyathus striatus]
MSNKVNIFVTGITGYIGGSVMAQLLEHPNAASFNITALSRSPEKAEKLKEFVTPVVGSHSDTDLLEKLASESDVVLAMADADNMEAAQAILKGLKKRYEKTGTAPILIHTSGTGVLADTASGKYSTETIYKDDDPAQLETLAPTQLHRDVDLVLLQADNEGYVKVYIVLPSTIYGIAHNKLVDRGIQNPHSVQIPALINASIARGQGGMVGEGKNIWPDVHIDDIASLYVTLFDVILSGKEVGHGREGFFFGENGEHTLYQIGEAIAKALVELGKGKSREPTTFTKEEIDKYFGVHYLGSNSRCRGNRSRALGWKPEKTPKDLLESIKPEVEALLNKVQEDRKYRK